MSQAIQRSTPFLENRRQDICNYPWCHHQENCSHNCLSCLNPLVSLSLIILCWSLPPFHGLPSSSSSTSFCSLFLSLHLLLLFFMFLFPLFPFFLAACFLIFLFLFCSFFSSRYAMTWSLDKCLGIIIRCTFSLSRWLFFAWQAQGMSALLQEQMKLSAASQAREPKDYPPCQWVLVRL